MKAWRRVLPSTTDKRVQTEGQRGFTLIELLVVVVIIAILAGLLLPASSRANATARTMVCLNNVRQLQVCWHLYASDSGEKLPPSIDWVAGVMTYDNNPDNTNTLKLLEHKPGRL